TPLSFFNHPATTEIHPLSLHDALRSEADGDDDGREDDDRGSGDEHFLPCNPHAVPLQGLSAAAYLIALRIPKLAEGAPEMNNAQKRLLFLAGGLAAGLALATFMQPDGEDWLSPAGPSLEERIGELERRLASESAARIALVDEIDALRGLLEADAAEAARPADELALLRRRTSGADVSPD